LLATSIPPSTLGGSGRLLISPLGLSPGLLFSALKTVGPQRLLVVTSEQAAGSIGEIMEAAGFPNLEHRILKVRDPHAGFSEERALLEPTLDTWLVESAAITVNLTGGTTALHWLAERIAERGAVLGIPVSRVAMVDRRPPETQRAEPYVLGEKIELSDLRHLAGEL